MDKIFAFALIVEGRKAKGSDDGIYRIGIEVPRKEKKKEKRTR